MFLLVIVLFYCNDINSQVKYKIKTKTYLRGVSSKSSSEGSFLYIIQTKNIDILYRRKQRHVVKRQAFKKKTFA